MKKTIIAIALAAPLALAACGSTESTAPSTASPAPTTERVIEETRGTGGGFIADDKVVPPTTENPAQAVDNAFIETLDEFGVRYTSESDVIRSGKVVCQFIDDGYKLSDLFFEMALDPQAERILPPVSNDDLPYVAGAAVPAYCPEHAAAVDRDLGNM